MKKIILFLTFFILWKYSSGQDELINTIRGQHDKCLFSYDDKYLLVYGLGGAKLYVNNNGKFEFLQKLDLAPDFYPFCASFSPDNRYLVFGNFHNTELCMFTKINHKFKKQYNFNPPPKFKAAILNVSFSPDGKYFVVSPFSDLIYILGKSVNSFNSTTTISYPKVSKQYSLFTNDGRYLIVVRSNGMVYFYDPNNNFTLIDSVNISHNFPSRMKFNVEHVAISPDDKALSITFFGQFDDVIGCQIYSIQTQNKKIQLEFVKQLSPSQIYSQFKSNDELLFQKEDSVLNYNLLTGKISLFHDNIQSIMHFSLSNNNNYFTVIDVEGNLFLENFTNWQHNLFVTDSSFVEIIQPQHAFFSETNKLLFVADLSESNDPKVRHLKIFDGNQNYRCKRIVKLPYELWKHTKLLCSPDGSILIFYGDREGFSAVPINSLNQENITFTSIKCGMVSHVDFSPDSRHLAAVLETGEIKIFNVLNPTFITELKSFKPTINKKITLLKFTIDNQILIVGYENGKIYLYSTKDYKLQQIITNGPKEPTEAFLSSDGKRLIIFGIDYKVSVYVNRNKWKLQKNYSFDTKTYLRKVLQLNDSLYLAALSISDNTLNIITINKDLIIDKKKFQTIYYDISFNNIKNIFYSPENHHLIFVENNGCIVTKLNTGIFKQTNKGQVDPSFLFLQAGGYYSSFFNLENIQNYLLIINLIYFTNDKLVTPLIFNNKFTGFSFGATEFQEDIFWGTYFRHAQRVYEGVFLNSIGEETIHQYRIQTPTCGLSLGFKIFSSLYAGFDFESTYFTFQRRILSNNVSTLSFKPVLEGKDSDGVVIPHFNVYVSLIPRMKNFGWMVKVFYSTRFTKPYMYDQNSTAYLINTTSWGISINYLFGNFKERTYE